SPSGASIGLPDRVVTGRPLPRLLRRQGDPIRFVRLAVLASRDEADERRTLSRPPEAAAPTRKDLPWNPSASHPDRRSNSGAATPAPLPSTTGSLCRRHRDTTIRP